MPTNRNRRRRKIAPHAIGDWTHDLVEKQLIPERGTPAHSQYLAWRFFGEEVPGLPAGNSREGMAIAMAAQNQDTKN